MNAQLRWAGCAGLLLGAWAGAQAAELVAVAANPNPLRYQGAQPPAVLVTMRAALSVPDLNRSCTVLLDPGNRQPVVRVVFDNLMTANERVVPVSYPGPGQYFIVARGIDGCSGEQRVLAVIEQGGLPGPVEPVPVEAGTVPPAATPPRPSVDTSTTPQYDQIAAAMRDAERAERARCPAGPVLDEVLGDVYPGATIHLRGSCFGTEGRVVLAVRKEGGGWYNSPDAVLVRWEDTFAFARIPEMPGVPGGVIEIGIVDLRFSRPSNVIAVPYSAAAVQKPMRMGRPRR